MFIVLHIPICVCPYVHNERKTVAIAVLVVADSAEQNGGEHKWKERRRQASAAVRIEVKKDEMGLQRLRGWEKNRQAQSSTKRNSTRTHGPIHDGQTC